RPSPKDRALDFADLALCFGDRRDRLPDALSTLLKSTGETRRQGDGATITLSVPSSLHLSIAPSPCRPVSLSLWLFCISRSRACHDDRGVTSRLIAEEIFREDAQCVIARRELRSVEELFAGQSAARDIGHYVTEDGQPLITRLAALGVNEFDHVVG